MTTLEEPCTFLAPYLLGELLPAQRDAYENHLASCESCQRALEPTSSLLASLAALGAANATAPAPPRRRRIGPLAGALAGLVAGLASGIALGSGIARAAQTPSGSPALTIPLSGSGLHGSLAVYRRPWGAQIAIHATGLPTSGTIELTVASVSGQRVHTAWRGVPRGAVQVMTAAPFAPSQIASTLIWSSAAPGPLWSWHRLGAPPAGTP
jgi:anti-sigma factor RsiW